MFWNMLNPLLSHFFFKQKTAYEMRISDWSSDVCSSDLASLARMEAAAMERHLASPSTTAVDAQGQSGQRLPSTNICAQSRSRASTARRIASIVAQKMLSSSISSTVQTPMPKQRSEERRVGKDSTCRSRWSPYH